jgi:hypothetical protein
MRTFTIYFNYIDGQRAMSKVQALCTPFFSLSKKMELRDNRSFEESIDLLDDPANILFG